MQEIFITNIKVNHSRNVENLNIPLSTNNRQHLIITGKNGSGKSSLLSEIRLYLSTLGNNQLNQREFLVEHQRTLFDNIQKDGPVLVDSNIATYNQYVSDLNGIYGGTVCDFSIGNLGIDKIYQNGHLLITHFESQRVVNLKIPKGITKVDLNKKYDSKERINSNFLQYIVNMKADRSFARDDNEQDAVDQIDRWFDNLERRLRYLFDDNKLALHFDRKNYNFIIVPGEGVDFTFNTLSDGYSSLLSIITELIMIMEARNIRAYDMQGFVLIDEIETHLHVDLQKKALPFLTDFFPKIQFIVSTHSPFVLSSIPNATICDLEKRIVTNDLSGYSYDALLESYFEVDKYSSELKQKLEEYDTLTSIYNKSFEETLRTNILKDYFEHLPKYLSSELHVKLQEIALKEVK